MSERKPERYRHHPDMDRSTAGDRIPIGARHEFADGVHIGYGDSEIHLPPRPARPSHFEARMAEIREWREKRRRRHIAVWKGLMVAALVLGALLMVAVTAYG